MPDTSENKPAHPRCANCAVPMWLVRIEVLGAEERQLFECKACEAKLIYTAPHKRED